MRHRDYSELAAPVTPLLDTYIGFFGAYERNNRHLITHDLTRRTEQASLLIGRGCLRLAQSDKDAAARRSFRQAKQLLVPLVSKSEDIYRSMDAARVLLLDSTVRMLELRHQPNEVTNLRTDMHERIMAQLTEIHRGAKRAERGRGRARLTGATNELTALGMLTRQTHPWQMGMPALQHHDQGEDATHNFDMLLIHTDSATVPARPHCVQVKSGCIGKCDNPDPTSQAVSAFDRYTKNITLISGCCDLGYYYDDTGDHFPLTQLLIGEWRGRAADDNNTTLDTATDRLVDTIVNDPTRRGHLPIA